MEGARLLQAYKIRTLANLDNLPAILKGDPQDVKFEPHQGRPVSVIGTIRTGEEWANYLARTGSFGPFAYLAALLAAANNSELAAYIPDYSVAKESQLLAEQGRDQSGFFQQTTPQINAANKHKPAEKPYSANPYSYAPYSKAKMYLKSGIKKAYSGIEDEVKKLFGRIRSVYQSRMGVIRSRKTYEGQDNNPPENVISLDSYRRARQGVQYQQPNDSSLEKRLAA